MLHPKANHYLQKLTTLKRGSTKHGLAPHKPILLLAIIDLIEKEEISENKIQLNERLLASFNKHWELLVETKNVRNIGLPIYHLQNDGFWNTITKEGILLNKSISSNQQFLNKLSHGIFEEPLFKLLQQSDYRAIFKMALTDTFFPNSKQRIQATLPSLFQEIEQEVLEEAPIYRKKTTVTEDFIRDWKFKTKVMDLYNYTCCISKLKVEPTFALIEAAHIKPHAMFGINTVTNGIPLCVYLHRAFDHGLISLSDNYKILVKGKKTFRETESPLNLRQFEGQEILLPEVDRYYPGLENLRWHRGRFGFK